MTPAARIPKPRRSDDQVPHPAEAEPSYAEAEPSYADAQVRPPSPHRGVPRMRDVVPEEPVYKAEDVAGQELLLWGVQSINGPNGEYVRLDVESENGERLAVNCGGQVVVRVAKHMEALVQKQEFAYPVQFRLVAKPGTAGRTFWDVE